MPVIHVQSICKNFGSLEAVKDLSFEVKEGEIFGFLGQNGSGKSTTIRMLLSLIHPSSGHIEIFRQDITAHRNQIAKKMGAIIERPDLYPYLTAKEHLQLFAKLSQKKISTSQIEHTLDQVGLSNRAFDKAQTFSLGMKQRLGIAIALVHQPELVILDEPTNGLDPQGIADIRHLIKDLAKEEGKTVLVSSHLLTEIEQMAHQILIIHQGRKIALGPTATLLDPTKSLMKLSTSNDAAAREKLASSEFAAYLLEREEGIYITLPTEQIAALHQYIVNEQIPILSLESKRSLEDYFLQITSQSN
jgi:ABC-type multidrug transport system ATPase subunit